MQKAVTPTSVKAAYHDASEIVQNRVYKSLKLWSMYADLEESFGTFKVRKNDFEFTLELFLPISKMPWKH